MLTFALPLLFVATALLAVSTIIASLHRALPLVAGLRSDLAACTDRREVRYRVIETVVRVNDGKIVTLPVKPRQTAPVRTGGLRAAA